MNFSENLNPQMKERCFGILFQSFQNQKKLIDGFGEMLAVFTDENISEVFYERTADDFKTVFC